MGFRRGLKRKLAVSVLATSMAAASLAVAAPAAVVGQVSASGSTLTQAEKDKVQDFINNLRDNGGYDAMLTLQDDIDRMDDADLLKLFPDSFLDAKSPVDGQRLFSEDVQAAKLARSIASLVANGTVFYTDVDDFRNYNSELFHRAFGDDVTVQTLRDFTAHVQSQAVSILLGKMVRHESLSGLSLSELTEQALRAAAAEEDLTGKLGAIGLSIGQLIDIKDGLYRKFGSVATNARDLAVQAYATTYMHIVKSGSTTPLTSLTLDQNASQDLDLYVVIPVSEDEDLKVPISTALPGGLSWEVSSNKLSLDADGLGIVTGNTVSSNNHVSVKLNGTTLTQIPVTVKAVDLGGAGGAGGGAGGGVVVTPPVTPPANGGDTGSKIGDAIVDAIQNGDLAPGKVDDFVKQLNDQLQNADDASKQAAVDGLQASLSNLTDSLAGKSAEDTKKAFDSVVSLAKGVQGVLAATDNNLSQIAAEVGADYVKKAAKTEVAAKVENGKASAVADAKMLSDIVEKATTALNEVKQGLADAGLADAQVETVLTFAVTGATDNTQASFSLSDLSAAIKNADKHSTYLEIVTDGVSVKVSVEDVLNALTAKATLRTAGEDNDYVIQTVKSDLTVQPPGKVQTLSGVKVVTVKATTRGVEVAKFKQPVEVGIQIGSLPAGINVEKIAAYQLVNNQWVAVGGKYSDGVVTFKTNQTGQFTAFVSNKTFADLSSVSWAQKEIEVMAAKGIVNGRSETKFVPGANVTRAEFAKLLVHALGLQDNTAESTFKDVKKGDWFYADVAAAAKLGIVNGVSENKFNPNAPISREEMAAMAARALKLNGASVKKVSERLAGFSDKTKIHSWAEEAIALSVKYGVIKGMNDGSFAPGKNATRAEAAVIMYRIFNQ